MIIRSLAKPTQNTNKNQNTAFTSSNIMLVVQTKVTFSDRQWKVMFYSWIPNSVPYLLSIFTNHVLSPM